MYRKLVDFTFVSVKKLIDWLQRKRKGKEWVDRLPLSTSQSQRERERQKDRQGGREREKLKRERQNKRSGKKKLVVKLKEDGVRGEANRRWKLKTWAFRRHSESQLVAIAARRNTTTFHVHPSDFSSACSHPHRPHHVRVPLVHWVS